MLTPQLRHFFRFRNLIVALALFAQLCWLELNLDAQVYTPVFPELSGSALTQAVVAKYKPTVVLNYADARDTMFARVFAADDDSVRCIYSLHTLYLDRTKNPRQYLYQNGGPLGISTEHVYPQSKGAGSGNARSDMHHLFPARSPVNTARSNKPFANIPDDLAKQWFYKAIVLTSKPEADAHLYSKSNSTHFEPRQAAKGDLARAVFYFYTMYTTEALNADSNFFESQRTTLCQWHYQDRADSAELIRTWRIARYQQDKPNPFILDCTLARRLYCPDLPDDCQVISSETVRLPIRVIPNPWPGQGRVEVFLPDDGQVQVRLFSVLGQELMTWPAKPANAGTFTFDLNMSLSLSGGLVVLEVILMRHENSPLRGTAIIVVMPE
ncbi:MAG: endonuclease [Saprospiraceae bacterium]|nr:endonuclease [Saprospiraceae bacterium]MDW8482799.1 endonuclease [Saprospiraceae bacterium]